MFKKPFKLEASSFDSFLNPNRVKLINITGFPLGIVWSLISIGFKNKSLLVIPFSRFEKKRLNSLISEFFEYFAFIHSKVIEFLFLLLLENFLNRLILSDALGWL